MCRPRGWRNLPGQYPAHETTAQTPPALATPFMATFTADVTMGVLAADAVHAAQSAAARAIGHPGGHESMPSPS